MIPSIYHLSAFTRFYAQRLLEDVPDAAMAEPAGGIVNHPAWQVAHVLCVYNMAARLLGGQVDPALAWADRWGPGSKPATDRAAYPGRPRCSRRWSGAGWR